MSVCLCAFVPICYIYHSLWEEHDMRDKSSTLNIDLSAPFPGAQGGMHQMALGSTVPHSRKMAVDRTSFLWASRIFRLFSSIISCSRFSSCSLSSCKWTGEEDKVKTPLEGGGRGEVTCGLCPTFPSPNSPSIHLSCVAHWNQHRYSAEVISYHWGVHSTTCI